VRGVWGQCEVFKTVRSVFTVNPMAKDIWRATGGFELFLDTLTALDGMFAKHDVLDAELELCFENMTWLMLCLLEALRGDGEADSFEHVLNRQYMRRIGYGEISRHLVNSGIFSKSKMPRSDREMVRYDVRMLHLIFCLIAGGYLPEDGGWGEPSSVRLLISTRSASEVETQQRPATIMNADAVLLLLDSRLVECLPDDWASDIIKQVTALSLNGGTAAFFRLARAGVTTYLCTNPYYHKAQTSSPAPPVSSEADLGSRVKKLICLIGTSSMDVTDLSASLIGLAGPMVENEKPKHSASAQYNKFDMVANMVSPKDSNAPHTLQTLLALAKTGQSESCAYLGSQKPTNQNLSTNQDVADAYLRESRLAQDTGASLSQVTHYATV
jgi:hypothetical protein